MYPLVLYKSNKRAKKNYYLMLENQNQEKTVILHTSDTAAAVSGQ